MKVASHQLPHMAAPHSAPKAWDAPAPDTAQNGFAQLLAQMRPVAPAEMQDNRHSAEIVPELGGSAQAFQNARLLVETALEYPAHYATPNTTHLASPIERQLLEQPQLAISSAPNTAARFGITTKSFDTPPSVPQPANTLPSGTSRLASPNGSTSTLQVPTQPSVAFSTAPQASSANRQPAINAVTSTATPTPKQTDGGHNSPFSAQLLATDGGPLLLLRLPKLAAAERADLENSAARLLQVLGLKRHQIVVQEISEGQG